MPYTHTRIFRTRHYECDALGHLSGSTYLRYMQETALDASAAVGYDLARYHAMNRYWLVRQTSIDYERPLGYNESVEVKTWVLNFGRVRSRRAYEFRRVGETQPVARAHTDWVFVDGTTGRPMPPPDDLKAAFFPEGLPAPSPSPADFPAPPPPPPGVFELRRRAAWQDIDPLQHVNNAAYLASMEDTAVEALAAYGWPADRLLAAKVWPATRQQRIEYRQAAVLGDELQIISWLAGVQPDAWRRYDVITRAADGALLAQARTAGIFIAPTTGRPVAAPEAFRLDLGPMVQADPHEEI